MGPKATQLAPVSPQERPAAKKQLVAIAASAGGLRAIERILLDLPRDYQLPILVVQHIADGFTKGLVEWLNKTVPLNVRVGEADEPTKPATVYFPPEDRHLGVTKSHNLDICTEPEIGGFRPSATYLFESAARTYRANLLAVTLIGMMAGRDGVDGLHAVKEFKGKVIALDGSSDACKAGVVDLILPLDQIARELIRFASSSE